MNLQLYRNNLPTVTIPIDENTIHTHEVMGVHEIETSFISASVLDIKVDDYILFRNERFNMNVGFHCQKRSNFEYVYSIVFESYLYWLKDKIFMHLGAVEFSYFGEASAYVQLIVDNMNEEDTGWSIGTIERTEPLPISFYGEEKGYTCKGALMKIAEEFSLEFWMTGKTIHLTKEAGVKTNLDFEYGRGKGLYSLTRGTLDTPLYNRIYGFGSTKNIPYNYRNSAKRLVFNERKLERPLAVGERRRETSVIFDDIFPSRTGALSAVSTDWLKLTDTSIDFDLDGLKVDGETPKVVFQTGELAGNEFEITGYNHSTKTITIEPSIEPDGYTMPNSTFEVKVGDQYTLIGIAMPQSYIDVAETKLRSETQKTFNQLSRPPYQVEIDEKYMRDNGIVVNAGDRVRLKDTALGIDDLIRVTSVSFPLVNENKVTAVISDTILYTSEVIQEIDKNKVKEEIKVVDRTKAELARRNMLQTRRLQNLTFDPDGYFDTERIKPLSIETGMLSVGAKSQNFGLNGISINANTEGDPNHLTISAGSLVHYEVEIEGLGYVWQIHAASFPALDPAKDYYLSAKCKTSALTGEWFLSEVPIITESEAGYWHFNLGILYPVMEGSRGFDFTKGMTFIVGDRIKSGILESLDGLNFFDLSQGKFKLGDEISGIDWDVSHENVLTIYGAVASSTVIVGSGGFVSAGLSGLADNGDESVRFWAGADLLNKEYAPFQVLDDGTMKTTKGEIGFLNVDANSLYLGDLQTGGSSDPWTALMNVVRFYEDRFMYRINGMTRGQIIEAAFNLYSNMNGSSNTEAFRITNTIENVSAGYGVNTGLRVDVANGDRNIGINSNAPILNKGFSGSYSRYQFTPTSGDNTLNPIKGGIVSVYISASNFNTVYLPEDQYINWMLGVNNDVDVCIKITVSNQFNSVSALNLRVDDVQGWTIRRPSQFGSTSVSFINMERGTTQTFIINRSGTTKWVSIVGDGQV